MGEKFPLLGGGGGREFWGLVRTKLHSHRKKSEQFFEESLLIITGILFHMVLMKLLGNARR